MKNISGDEMAGTYKKYHKKRKKPAGRMKLKIPAGFLFAWLLTAAVLLGSVIPVKALNMPVWQTSYYRTENIRQDNNSSRAVPEVKLSDNDLHALSAVLMDGNNGRVLYDKAGEEVRANASTTKILTCILALEYGDPDDVVIVSSYAAKMPDVQLNIKEGEEYRLKDLLYSLMLESHNDSAVAIAEHIGGSVEAFSGLMNQKAKDIGCTNTHFITPNGLDAKDEHGIHGTSAEDLARIMRYCIRESPKREQFLAITRTASYAFTNIGGTRSFSCNNHNTFLNMMDGALTGKTGFTGSAGYCYVGALERDGKLLIVALLGCGWPGNKTYKWADTKKLMNYGLTNYQEHVITDDILQKNKIPVLSDSVYGTMKEDTEAVDWECHFSETLLLRADEQISVKYLLPEYLKCPIYAGMQAGSVVLSIDGKAFAIYPVIITENVQGESIHDFIKEYIKDYIGRNFS